MADSIPTFDMSCFASWLVPARLRGIRAKSVSLRNNTVNPTANTVTLMASWEVRQTILVNAIHLSTAIACLNITEIVLANVIKGADLSYPSTGQSSDQILMSHVCLPNSDGSKPYLTQSNKTNKLILPNPILIDNNSIIGIYCRSSAANADCYAFATIFYVAANERNINFVQT
jgi:hypothetical protein